MNVKMNMKGIYDTYECEVCLMEDESQKHVYECKEIWKKKESNDEHIPKYENILDGNVKEMSDVARIMQENMKIQQKVQNLE